MRASGLLLCLALAACGDSASAPDPGPGSGSPETPATSLGGCTIFPADNAWNRDISGDPVAADGAALLAAMSPGNALHLDLGTTEEYYGIPWLVVPAGQPMATIEFGVNGEDYGDESDAGPMPIPLDAPIEGGAAPIRIRARATATSW